MPCKQAKHDTFIKDRIIMNITTPQDQRHSECRRQCGKLRCGIRYIISLCTTNINKMNKFWIPEQHTQTNLTGLKISHFYYPLNFYNSTQWIIHLQIMDFAEIEYLFVNLTFGGATVTSSMERSCFGPRATAARHLMGWPIVEARRKSA